jgi:hypothetical protein
MGAVGDIARRISFCFVIRSDIFGWLVFTLFVGSVRPTRADGYLSWVNDAVTGLNSWLEHLNDIPLREFGLANLERPMTLRILFHSGFGDDRRYSEPLESGIELTNVRLDISRGQRVPLLHRAPEIVS